MGSRTKVKHYTHPLDFRPEASPRRLGALRNGPRMGLRHYCHVVTFERLGNAWKKHAVRNTRYRAIALIGVKALRGHYTHLQNAERNYRGVAGAGTFHNFTKTLSKENKRYQRCPAPHGGKAG